MTTKQAFEQITSQADRVAIGNGFELRIDGKLVGTEKDGVVALLSEAVEDVMVKQEVDDMHVLADAMAAQFVAKSEREIKPVPKPGKKISMKAEVEIKKPAAVRPEPETINLRGLVSDDKSGLREVTRISIDEIVEFPAGDPPTRAFVESVRLNGVIEPIVVRETGVASKGFEVIEGRRRVAAAKLAGLQSIVALVEHRGDVDDDVTALVLNEQRSANLIDQHRHVTSLIAKGRSIKEIMAATGMTEHEVTRARDISKLHPDLIHAIESGAMAAHATLNAARMSGADQEKLIAILKKEGKVTARDVTAVRRARQTAATAEVAPGFAEALPDLPMPEAKAEVAKEEQDREDEYMRVAKARAGLTDGKKVTPADRRLLVARDLFALHEVMKGISKPSDDDRDVLTFIQEAIDRLK